MLDLSLFFPGLNGSTLQEAFNPLGRSSCKLFSEGVDGVRAILTPDDRKVEFVVFDDKILTIVKSQMGYPAIYPLIESRIEKPVTAVLMDLDGTSVKSESFWIWIIEQTTARLLDNAAFSLEEEDIPHVSSHSVSEHLSYCLRKYCPDKRVEEARRHYFDITNREMKAIVDGTGRTDAFTPREGLKEFLLELKSRGIRIGLVTSGLFEKAWPEIISAFRQLDMGDPLQFYDAIISAGHAMRKGQAGTLGELSPKPHPWLYAETARVGLGIEQKDRFSVVGLEDSSAGIVSIRLAGFAALGLNDGNIAESGVGSLAQGGYDTLEALCTALW